MIHLLILKGANTFKGPKDLLDTLEAPNREILKTQRAQYYNTAWDCLQRTHPSSQDSDDNLSNMLSLGPIIYQLKHSVLTADRFRGIPINGEPSRIELKISSLEQLQMRFTLLCMPPTLSPFYFQKCLAQPRKHSDIFLSRLPQDFKRFTQSLHEKLPLELIELIYWYGWQQWVKKRF